MVPGYHEVRELGAGGGGRVVLATYAATGAYVAIKYLNEPLRQDHRFLARFREEARVMVELHDPNVVQFYEYYEDVLQAAIVMELVDGVALRRILADHGTTSPEAALVVLKGSLLGLAFAHSAGIVHRDYKPENVLIQADGSSKLTDFGVAARTGEPGTPAGTPPYMAPEQWTGHPATAASDVYAATCVFFECLTGHRPYRGDHQAALMHQHRNAPIPLEAVPGSVRGLVARGMAKNPADRPATAEAFVVELEAAAAAAYGPEWEQRGRRHLAELATLLALTFPLARPTRKVSSSIARSVVGRVGGVRRPRLGPRILAGVAVITVAVTVGMVASSRSPDRLSADTIFTPAPSSPSAEERPPSGTEGSSPQEPASAFQPSGHDTGQDSAPSGNTSPSRPDHSSGSTSSGGETGSKPPSPTHTPVRPHTPPPNTPPPTTPPPAPVHGVSDLAISRMDAGGATVSLRASTPANVVLTVRFAEGDDPDRLTEAPPRGFTLTGADAYSQPILHAFTVPACDQTLYRRVTASTSPRAAGGTVSRTAEVTGAPCPAPPVQNVKIASWDGDAATVKVRAGGPGKVRLTAVFTRKDGEGTASTVSTLNRTLSGETGYTVDLPGPSVDVPCDGRAVLGLTVTTDLPAANGTQYEEATVEGEKCAPPAVTITSFSGTTVGFRVRTSSTSPVTVKVGFTQTVVTGEAGKPTGDVKVLELSGRTEYRQSVTGVFAPLPECGRYVRRVVTITTVPVGEGDSSERRIELPSCQPEPSSDGTTGDGHDSGAGDATNDGGTYDAGGNG
ncbi:serine/threonine-protein kinase [Streptosporangium sp. NPDC051022]|uniref:serine/threonine-protein kinase n=1 Tax=Streptosporangium sp. NPDC051022 TaxID=3155752 RepID=UPI00341FBF77